MSMESHLEHEFSHGGGGWEEGERERERERERDVREGEGWPLGGGGGGGGGGCDLTAMHNYLSLRSGGERHLIIISLSWAHIIHCTSHGSIQKVLWELRLLLKQKYVKEFGALSLNRSDCKLSLSLSPSPSLLSWNSSAIIRLSAQPQTHQKTHSIHVWES